MNLSEFAIWRFKNAEGVMDYITRWNATECELNVRGKRILITYDMEHDTASFSNIDDPYNLPVTCSFKDFQKTLTQYGYFKERTINRHAQSYKSPDK